MLQQVNGFQKYNPQIPRCKKRKTSTTSSILHLPTNEELYLQRLSNICKLLQPSIQDTAGWILSLCWELYMQLVNKLDHCIRAKCLNTPSEEVKEATELVERLSDFKHESRTFSVQMT
jgi:hypothetical protein